MLPAKIATNQEQLFACALSVSHLSVALVSGGIYLAYRSENCKYFSDSTAETCISDLAGCSIITSMFLTSMFYYRTSITSIRPSKRMKNSRYEIKTNRSTWTVRGDHWKSKFRSSSQCRCANEIQQQNSLFENCKSYHRPSGFFVDAF